MRTKDYAAYDGAVTWHMFPRQTLLFDTVWESLFEAFPDQVKANDNGTRTLTDDAQGRQISLFLFAFGCTADITFNLAEDSDPLLFDYQEWWREAVVSKDYRTLFGRFQRIADKRLLNDWYEAYNATRGRQLLAPDALQASNAADPNAETPESDTLKASGETSRKKQKTA